MKYYILSSGEKKKKEKKNVIDLSSAEFAHSMLTVF